MTLTLYNTLTRRKEPFRPIDPANVRMYVCGPTVYDYAHIGNARPVIVFDVLFRLLRHIYGAEHVTYARNITDVDDKINARAAEDTASSIRELTETTARQFHEDIEALGVLPPTVEPRATEHIAEMKALIEALVANGHAYVAEDHVLFDVPSMPDYGRLSNRSLEEMEAGARVEVAPYKKGPDGLRAVEAVQARRAVVAFARAASRRRAGPAGTSSARPWRRSTWARCSTSTAAASTSSSRTTRTRSRRSRCAHGTPVMAQLWMHNGFLQVEGEKMSQVARQLRHHP